MQITTIADIPKITFVCCPKPFLPQYKDIQNNAIVSWTKLKCVNKIIICGKDEGVKEYTENLKTLVPEGLDIIYHPNLNVNSNGTPLVDHLFKICSNNTEKYVCYINADIILLSDFDKTFQNYLKAYPDQKDFLLIGQRWDWYQPKAIDFSNGWEKRVTHTAKNNGSMHQITGIDYFIHTKTTFPKMYPFALGKFWWDNWIVGNAYKRRPAVMCVDLTPTVFAIHQNSPWMVGKKLINDRRKALNCPEARKNKSYDPYGLNIGTGTTHKSAKDSNGNIVFHPKKDNMPAKRKLRR